MASIFLFNFLFVLHLLYLDLRSGDAALLHAGSDVQHLDPEIRPMNPDIRIDAAATNPHRYCGRLEQIRILKKVRSGSVFQKGGIPRHIFFKGRIRIHSV